MFGTALGLDIGSAELEQGQTGVLVLRGARGYDQGVCRVSLG